MNDGIKRGQKREDKRKVSLDFTGVSVSFITQSAIIGGPGGVLLGSVGF